MTSSQAQDATGTADIPVLPDEPGSRAARSTRRAQLREAAASHPVSRVTIWNDSTPWIITGHAEQRALLSTRG